jgi:hypothetical protein
MDMVHESWQNETFPLSTRTSVLTLIHKGDERDNIKNYCPISLTNRDYKIIAFVFAERLQSVISSVIDDDQSGYIKSRYIGCNVRSLLDIYEYTEKNNIPGAFLCTDFKKAFDSLEHNFMLALLKKFNFGNNFTKWISIFYNMPGFKMKNNGWISERLPMNRGIRQGCPLSALLFILSVEILAVMIR